MPQINNNNNNSNVNNKMIYELAKDYSAYMKVDLPNQVFFFINFRFFNNNYNINIKFTDIKNS